MPDLSIITPSFNQAQYLEYTIRSVLAQDFPGIEYLVIDGGSTDGSLDIIRRYADRLAWWVSEPDQGQADAINKGFSRASGEYIAWLNSDDIYLPGAVSTAIQSLDNDKKVGMVYGDAITIDERGRPLNRLVFGDWGLDDLMGFRIICQPAVFMRRSVLEKAGFLDPAYHFMLDHQLWIRMAMQAPIKHVTKALAAARHHPMAKNVAQAENFGEETMRIVDWMASQPELAAKFNQNRNQILGGAHRLKARYLLDGDQPAPALRSYGRALAARPGFAIQHWHRMLYASLIMVGAGRFASDTYRRLASQRNPTAEFAMSTEFDDWPGLMLSGE